MGINDTTTQTHTEVGAIKCLEAIYHNSTTSTYNSTFAKERPWAEQLTSLPKRGSGSSFLLLAVRKSREAGNEARGRGGDSMPSKQVQLINHQRLRSRVQMATKLRTASCHREHGVACGAHVPH